MQHDSLISDELLNHLMAVGHVDVLVGVPTLNNASTIRGVVRAVHTAFATDFPRDRTVLLTSDGGSSDGTPALVRDCAADEADTLTVSHSLRTVHRISTPYHGVPGKGNALRQIMAAADLTQARAVAVLDADVTSVTPAWITALIRPVRDAQYDYVAPVYRRHPLDGPLVTQLVRPLMRAAYGWHVREPLAPEFGCSGRFLAHCLEQDVWHTDLARVGIDLWVMGAALAGGFRCCQAGLGPRVHSPGPQRPAFTEVFEQVVESLFECLERQAAYWLARTTSEPLPITSPVPDSVVDPPAADGSRLTQSFCDDVRNLQAVLQPILRSETLSVLNQLTASACDRLVYPDELWAATVCDFLLAHHRGVMRREHIVRALIPLYLGRTGSFLIHAPADEAAVDLALESLCQQFERSKPDLVERWTHTHPR